MSIVTLILGIAWFLLPAYISNMTPPLIGNLIGTKWNWPADFGLTLKGKRILGSHKTIRGFVGGTALAILAGYLQTGWSSSQLITNIALIDYSAVNGALLGGLLGFGALLGDSVKSFFKRRVGIKPGGRWIPFDQIDFVIGSFLLSWPLASLSWQVWVIALVAHPFVVIGVKHLGFYLGLNDVKW